MERQLGSSKEGTIATGVTPNYLRGARGRKFKVLKNWQVLTNLKFLPSKMLMKDNNYALSPSFYKRKAILT